MAFRHRTVRTLAIKTGVLCFPQVLSDKVTDEITDKVFMPVEIRFLNEWQNAVSFGKFHEKIYMPVR
jgi:hypothetical protein